MKKQRKIGIRSHDDRRTEDGIKKNIDMLREWLNEDSAESIGYPITSVNLPGFITIPVLDLLVDFEKILKEKDFTDEKHLRFVRMSDVRKAFIGLPYEEIPLSEIKDIIPIGRDS